MQLTQAYLFLASANPVLFALERMREEERQKDKMNIKFITMLFWGFHRCLISSCVQPHTHTPKRGSINVCRAFSVFDLA